MTKLSVNINLAAYIRNRRDACPIPNVADFARTALLAGASGITVHPRPDQRHITTADVYDIKSLLVAEFPDREFNIEGYPTREFLDLVADIGPEQVTLVPDDPAQKTSDHGWDIDNTAEQLRSALGNIDLSVSRVSTFVDHATAPAQLETLADIGVAHIELYTGPFAAAQGAERDQITEFIAATGAAAKECGLGVNAGHDLNLTNIAAICQAVPHLHEVSIGHALFCEALQDGLSQTVRSYVKLLTQNKGHS